jgi:hypothetical protein
MDEMNMNKKFRGLWVMLLIGCSMLLFASDGKSQDNGGSTISEPPLKFRISEASIEMHKNSGYSVSGAADTIVLRGNGEGELIESQVSPREHHRYPVRFSAEDFGGLLRLFYLEQFFTFGPRYTGWKSLSDVASDGTVGTLTTGIVDAPTITLIVRIEDYVKSVTFVSGKALTRKPASLDSLAQEVEDFTKRLCAINSWRAD